MSYHYMMKYKGVYRLKAEIDQETYDFPRNAFGVIDDTFDDIYIDCRYGNRIYYHGKTEGIPGVLLWAYIPSINRGRRIHKELQSAQIPTYKYRESEDEVSFLFDPKDVDTLANLLIAKTLGAAISPFSKRNLPKSNTEIPSEQMQKYKQITGVVKQGDLLVINSFTSDFVKRIMVKAIRRQRKDYSFEQDIRANKMSRSVRAYIWKMGFFDKYLAYLEKKIKSYYKNKEKQDGTNHD